MLLSDPRFSQARSTHDCVLAWQSLRPAPKVTIDFGNGRRLQRTIKGSTVIYLCRPDGSVIDAYPGIYTPADFLPLLAEGRQHLGQSQEQIQAWHRHPEARLAMVAPPLTASKAVMQGPLLKAIGEPPPPLAAGPMADLSKYPMSRPQVVESLGLPPQSSGLQVVEADSHRYRQFARPEAHRILGRLNPLPDPAECALPMFKEVLHVPLDDPYLGLKDEDMPGTP